MHRAFCSSWPCRFAPACWPSQRALSSFAPGAPLLSAVRARDPANADTGVPRRGTGAGSRSAELSLSPAEMVWDL